MRGICLACGRERDLEAHHLAGRANHDLVVPVCIDCHRILTNWQLAHGVNLDAEEPRTTLDRRRALIQGSLDLLRLADLRDPLSTAPPGLMEHTARAMSRLLDLAGPPERPGRWQPDATIRAELPGHVEPDPHGIDDRIRQFAYLLTHLIREFGDEDQLTADLAEAVVAYPGDLQQVWGSLHAANHDGPRLAVLIIEHLDASHRLMHDLLRLENWAAVDEQLLDESRTWFDTGTCLLREVVRQAKMALGVVDPTSEKPADEAGQRRFRVVDDERSGSLP